MRALWMFARRALEEADRLWVIGYSLPDSDFSMRALLASGLAGKRIGAVDPEPAVLDRFKRAIPGAQFQQGDYVPSVQEFVEAYAPEPV
jgi:hypothetical protein